jgi:hypothetical protein
MKGINNTTLAILSLLIIPGFLLVPVLCNTGAFLIPIIMSGIGGFALGHLIGRQING